MTDSLKPCDELVERVARAIYASSARTVADTRPEWEVLDGISRRTFKLHIRAAIEAAEVTKLREALKEPALEACLALRRHGEHDAADALGHAMKRVDAALAHPNTKDTADE